MRKDDRQREEPDTMRPEYDFSGAARGETAARYREGNNLMAITPDVLDVFPDGDAANEALRALAVVIRQLREADTGLHRT